MPLKSERSQARPKVRLICHQYYKQVKCGKGSDVKMTIPNKRHRNSLFVNRVFDHTDEGVFFNANFIGIGHELIHAVNNMQGRNKTLYMTLGEYGTHIPSERLKKIYTNAEEYWTIHGSPYSENSLLIEHGFPERYGHYGEYMD